MSGYESIEKEKVKSKIETPIKVAFCDTAGKILEFKILKRKKIRFSK